MSEINFYNEFKAVCTVQAIFKNEKHINVTFNVKDNYFSSTIFDNDNFFEQFKQIEKGDVCKLSGYLRNMKNKGKQYTKKPDKDVWDLVLKIEHIEVRKVQEVA